MIQLSPTVQILDNLVEGRYHSDLSLPIPAPIISNVTGDFTYNSEITITGSFTAKDPHQLAYLTGDINNLGQTDSRLTSINTNLPVATDPHTYNHNAETSIVGSGASLKFHNVGKTASGPKNPCTLMPPLTKEVYVSYIFKPNIIDWDSQHGSQIKMGRLNGTSQSHSNTPIFGMTPLHTQGSTATINDIYSSDQLTMVLKENGTNTNLTIETFMNQWCRFEYWVKLPPHYAVQEYRNKIWAGATLPEQNKVFNCVPYMTAEMTLSDQLAKYNYETSAAPKYWQKFMLPFYIRDWMDIMWWVDGVYVNTSPERVEFANNPVLHLATKRFVQPVKQNSRLINSIVVNCQTGNFVPADNIYCFVVNSDGKHSAPFLYRPAV